MDMESYYKGQIDMVKYLYELLLTAGIGDVVQYLSKCKVALEGEDNNG